MDAISQVDAACLPVIIADSPVSFVFGGATYTGTAGPRDTMKSLTDGGFHADHEIVLLVAISEFDGVTPPAEKDTVTLSLNTFGIPCHVNDQVSTKDARVRSVGRSGAGLTYTFGNANRG